MSGETLAWLALLALALVTGPVVMRAWARRKVEDLAGGPLDRPCWYCEHERGDHLLGPERSDCTARGCPCVEFMEDDGSHLRCHVCRCTDDHACEDDDGTGCHWVRVYPPERALCSHCVETEQALENPPPRPLKAEGGLLGNACAHCPHGSGQHVHGVGGWCATIACDCPGYEPVMTS
jgi:hypothetical protein